MIIIMIPAVLPCTEINRSNIYACVETNETSTNIEKFEISENLWDLQVTNTESNFEYNMISNKLNNNINSIVDKLNSFVVFADFNPGDQIDEDFFKSIRSTDEYLYHFESFVSKLDDESIYSLIYYLSNVKYSLIYSFEANFIKNVLEQSDVYLQEIALQAVENWRDTKFISSIKGIKLKNYYLQKEFEKLFV